MEATLTNPSEETTRKPATPKVASKATPTARPGAVAHDSATAAGTDVASANDPGAAPGNDAAPVKRPRKKATTGQAKATAPGTAKSAPRKPATKNATTGEASGAAKANAKPQPRAEAPEPVAPPRGSLGETASNNTLAVNPLIGIRPGDFGRAAQTLVGAVVTEPLKAARHLGSWAKAMGKAVLSATSPGVDAKDKRFMDPAWQHNPALKRVLAAHATTAAELTRYIDSTSLSDRDKARAHLVASIFVDAIAPSNSLLNPTALKRVIDTGGQSLLQGAKHLVHDLRHNKGLPSSVDKSGFTVGKNLATSPGAVVFRNEVLELIQYKPATETVFSRPLLICPPQVNKFYAMDLTPEKSLVKFVTGQGLQLFAISWRNPTKQHCDWNLSTYVQALDEAVSAVLKITGSPDLSLWGACSGGMTTAAYLGWLAATGQKKVRNVMSPVCVLNPQLTMDTTMGLLASDQSLAALKKAVKRKGIVDGAELARVFAWLRPNDLIWNYWVNNYLLGNKPPAFDILYWNADTTRLPAAFHADLISIFEKNPFVTPGAMQVLGKPIDMGQVDVDAYIVAGITDHITPWKACWSSAWVYGKNSQFILANAGHLQSLLNPPGLPKSFFFAAPVDAPDPDTWAAGATRTEGSWWLHWMAWMHARSGERIPTPKKLGSRKYPPGVAAPGEYIFEP